MTGRQFPAKDKKINAATFRRDLPKKLIGGKTCTYSHRELGLPVFV
jgi:hypothetical protein